MLLACLRVMWSGLQFNICHLQISQKRTTIFSDLEDRRTQGFHVQHAIVLAGGLKSDQGVENGTTLSIFGASSSVIYPQFKNRDSIHFSRRMMKT